MMLLYSQEQYVELFQWSMDGFTYRQIDAAQTIDLAHISRFAVCSEILEQPPDGVLLFHSLLELDNHAMAHYVMWQPALYQWEIERKLRKIQQLQRRIAQLKHVNENLGKIVYRTNRVLEKLQANPSLITGDDKLCLHSELISEPQQP